MKGLCFPDVKNGVLIPMPHRSAFPRVGIGALAQLGSPMIARLIQLPLPEVQVAQQRWVNVPRMFSSSVWRLQDVDYGGLLLQVVSWWDVQGWMRLGSLNSPGAAGARVRLTLLVFKDMQIA